MTYLRLNDGHESFKISTDDVIPAIQIVKFLEPNTTLSISDYLVAYQLTTESEKNEDGMVNFKKQATPLLPCNEVYPVGEYPSALTD